MQGKVEICGVNTAELPVLKSAETKTLLERARAGDKQAREKLIAGNLRLVLSVVQRFSGRGESMDDLFQVGVIGLIKAVDAFDLTQGVQFSTYGVPMIAGELRRFLRDHSALRVSRSMRDTAYRVLQAKEKLLASTGREPSVEALSAETGIARPEIVFAMDAICEPVSLYEPVFGDGGESACIMDQIGEARARGASWPCAFTTDARRPRSPARSASRRRRSRVWKRARSAGSSRSSARKNRKEGLSQDLPFFGFIRLISDPRA